MARLVDGLGFRYRWATEGLRGEETTWRATPENMSLGEMLRHIYGLVYWVSEQFDLIDGFPLPAEIPPNLELRRPTLDLALVLREHLAGASDRDLYAVRMQSRDTVVGFWNMINGPLCDALTHVGQINAWRRIMGNPSPPANVFLGRPS